MSQVLGVARPADLAQACATLAGTTGRVQIRGAGTAPDWAGRPDPPDVLLDTTALTGVITHNPGDMTVSVRAGTLLRELNAQLAGHGQRVALDAARVELGATVGGLLATADSGPSSLVNGSLRDLVIGTTVVLANGTPTRSGGHVIKNVAGYDLAKLMHGCHGTLALIAEVVLRLHPVPAATSTVRLPGALPESLEPAGEVLRSPLEPVALEWCDEALLVRLAGGSSTIDARADRLAELLGSAACRLDASGQDRAWAEHADLVAGRGGRAPEGGAVLRVGARPSRLPALLATLAREVTAVGITAGLATGVATMRLPADPDVVSRAHQLAHRVGASSMLRSRPADSTAPAWGPAPSAVAVLRAVRTELDPDGRFGAGRFAPWM